MFLPYLTLEDFFNSQITQISFPSINTQTVNQRNQNYPLTKRGGLQLDQSMEKTLTLTIKLSQSYITYFMVRQQFEEYLKFVEGLKELYMPPISVTILDDDGFETVTYSYNQLTPTGLSDFDLSYAARPGSFNTFTWTFSYNYFDIWYRDNTGERKALTTGLNTGYLNDPGMIDMSKVPEYQGAISRQLNLKNNSL